MVADEIRRVPRELVEVSYTLGAAAPGDPARHVARGHARDLRRAPPVQRMGVDLPRDRGAGRLRAGPRLPRPQVSRFLQTPRIWVYLAILGVIGLALDFSFRAASRRLFRWANTAAT